MHFLKTKFGVLHYWASDIVPARKTLVFINSLGTDFRIWDGVVSALAERYNIVLHDKAGHGLSSERTRPVTIANYASDVESLLQHLGIPKATVCGLSVGGLIAQSLYHIRPDLVEGLILSNTGLKIGTADTWGTRITAIADNGIASIADQILERWFSPDFRQSRKSELTLYRNMLVRSPKQGYIACCEAIRDADFTAEAAHIKVPVLCIGGEHDGSTPPPMITQMASHIAGAQLEIIPGVAHLPCIETADVHAGLIAKFVETL